MQVESSVHQAFQSPWDSSLGIGYPSQYFPQTTSQITQKHFTVGQISEFRATGFVNQQYYESGQVMKIVCLLAPAGSICSYPTGVVTTSRVRCIQEDDRPRLFLTIIHPWKVWTAIARRTSLPIRR